MTENTIASNSVRSNTSTSTKDSVVLQYPRVFPLPEQWNLSLPSTPSTPSQIQNDNTDKNTESIQSSILSSQKVFTHSLTQRSNPTMSKSSTTLYDSILEQLRTHSHTDSQEDIPVMSPIKIEKTFMDDYFEEG